MKIISLGDKGPKKAHEIPIGTVFSGTVEDFTERHSGIFFRMLGLVVCLSDSSLAWEIHGPAITRVFDYQELDAELMVSPK